MLILMRVLIHFSAILPFAWLCWVLWLGDETVFGADPVKEIEHFLGYTAIILLCVMFLLGILLQIFKRNQYQILRRPLGIWAFVWAILHILSYVWLELGQDISLFLMELTTRPYLIFGAAAFSILLMMSLTSLPSLKRWLGKRWFPLHQFAYLAILCAFIHYYWSVKSLTLAPILIGVAVAIIFAWKYGGKWLLARFQR